MQEAYSRIAFQQPWLQQSLADRLCSAVSATENQKQDHRSNHGDRLERWLNANVAGCSNTHIADASAATASSSSSPASASTSSIASRNINPLHANILHIQQQQQQASLLLQRQLQQHNQLLQMPQREAYNKYIIKHCESLPTSHSQQQHAAQVARATTSAFSSLPAIPGASHTSLVASSNVRNSSQNQPHIITHKQSVETIFENSKSCLREEIVKDESQQKHSPQSSPQFTSFTIDSILNSSSNKDDSQAEISEHKFYSAPLVQDSVKMETIDSDYDDDDNDVDVVEIYDEHD